MMPREECEQGSPSARGVRTTCQEGTHQPRHWVAVVFESMDSDGAQVQLLSKL